MSDNKSPRIPPIRKPLEAAVPVRPGTPAPAGRPERGAVPRSAPSRHSAITRNLQSYASYKLWAEKIRSSWEPGEDPKG
jgi:hypothetical protein